MTTQTPRPRISRLIWLALLLVAAIVLGGELYLMKFSPRHAAKPLPVLAKVPEFSFTSQSGATVTRESMLGKVWVADFIFTRCAGPCPLMTEQMRRLQNATESAGEGVRLVSTTVDAAYDTPPVLTKYAAKYGANPDRWSFLTGDPAKIESFITKGMLLGLAKDNEGAPIHAQKFVVIDREGRIRAYHDLEDGETLLPKLIEDIDALSQEKSAPAAN